MAESSQIPTSVVAEERREANCNLKLSRSLHAGLDSYTTAPYENGYHFPPKHTCLQSIMIQLHKFWRFFSTPFGFLVTIYGLNIVAWGGMLFLLLCNAAPAMCKPSCQDINSSRRIWIEIDSQILNGLFCVTGFGTIPWRFRDFWYLIQYRIFKQNIGLRRLAGINKSWFRLPGSQDIPILFATGGNDLAGVSPDCLPFPLSKTPRPPLTGTRAPPTAIWKLDLVIWAMVWNTLLQGVLSGLMWGLDRFNRPSWSTGLFITLGCLFACFGGLIIFVEGKKVKTIEGVPVSGKDLDKLVRDKEAGILHWNNIKDKRPREMKEKEIITI